MAVACNAGSGTAGSTCIAALISAVCAIVFPGRNADAKRNEEVFMMTKSTVK